MTAVKRTLFTLIPTVSAAWGGVAAGAQMHTITGAAHNVPQDRHHHQDYELKRVKVGENGSQQGILLIIGTVTRGDTQSPTHLPSLRTLVSKTSFVIAILCPQTLFTKLPLTTMTRGDCGSSPQ